MNGQDQMTANILRAIDDREGQVMMKKIFCVMLILVVAPVFFFIYQPSLQLEGLGMAIGVVGMSLTPLAILFLLYYFLRNEWR